MREENKHDADDAQKRPDAIEVCLRGEREPAAGRAG